MLYRSFTWFHYRSEPPDWQERPELRLRKGFGLDTRKLLGIHRRLRRGGRSRILGLGTVIELLHELIAGEYSLLEIIGKLERVLRTSSDAKHAECAASEVIHILVKFLFLLPVGQLHHLRGEFDSPVRAIHLADTAGDTLMVSLRIILESQFSTEPVGYLERVSVLRILLRHLGSHKLLAGDGHTGDETLQSFSYT